MTSLRRRALGVVLLVIAVALVVVVAVTDVGPTLPFQTVTRGKGLGARRNLVVDGSGNRFVFKIATVYFLPFYTAADGTADPALAASSARLFTNRQKVLERIRELGGNTIRVPMGSAVYKASGDPYELGGAEALVERFAQLVADADRLGMKVIPSWWDATGAGERFTSSYAEAFPMMRAVERKVRGRHNVVFEPWNEPNGISWGDWQAVMNATLKFFRTDLGYKDLLILDTIDFSWSFSSSAASKVQDADEALLGMSNVAFANHRYANADTCFCDAVLASWENEVGKHVGAFPIIGTEYGFWNRDWPPSPVWNQQLVAHLTDKTADGLNGYGAFTWNWVDRNTMTLNDLTTLTDFGMIAVTYWQDASATQGSGARVS